jgi:hypothetical protein
MYGTYRNSGIRRITRYEEALHRLNNTKPIAGNGRNAGIVPLGHRNRPHFQLRMRQDESIACRLYRSDVVVFDKDGTITIDPDGYSTISTASFISEVLGVSARQYDNRLVVHVNNGTYQAEGLKLRSVDAWDHRYEVVECEQDVVHNIDRKVMNALRKDTQEYRKFLHGFMKIKDYTLTDEELQELDLKEIGRLAFDVWQHNAENVMGRFNCFMGMVRSGDAGNWHSSSMWLCASARYSTWDKKFDPRKVIALLDDILIAVTPTALVAKPVEVGAIKVDTYAKFKPFREGA